MVLYMQLLFLCSDDLTQVMDYGKEREQYPGSDAQDKEGIAPDRDQLYLGKQSVEGPLHGEYAYNRIEKTLYDQHRYILFPQPAQPCLGRKVEQGKQGYIHNKDQAGSCRQSKVHTDHKPICLYNTQYQKKY
ncbi:hypothetical protein D3C72_552130 [compost metagenome]